MIATRYKVTCSDGRSYSETTWGTLDVAMEKARVLASYGYAVRVRDWRGGAVLFESGGEPAKVYRQTGVGAADRLRSLLQTHFG